MPIHVNFATESLYDREELVKELEEKFAGLQEGVVVFLDYPSGMYVKTYGEWSKIIVD